MSSRDQKESPKGAKGRWAQHGDLLRTQLQETGRIRLSFIRLHDLVAACNDLGIDPSDVEFEDGYAVVRDG